MPALVLVGMFWWLSIFSAPSVRAEKLPVPGSNKWVQRQNHLAIRAARMAYWNEAVYRWLQILRYHPDWPQIWNNLAIAMEAMGRWEDADTFYRRALQLDPNNPDIRANFIRFQELRQRFGTPRKETKKKDGDKAPESKKNKNSLIENIYQEIDT